MTTPLLYMVNTQKACKVCGNMQDVENFTHHYLKGKKYYERKCKSCRSKERRIIQVNPFILQDGEILTDWVKYKGKYKISNYGRICSLTHSSGQGSRMRDVPKVLKTPLNGRGYPNVVICVKERIYKSYRVHRLVAEHFIDNINNFPCINHKDGDKTNNRVENLEWCSFQYNLLHARRTGLNPVLWGEGRERSSLKNNDVLEILRSNLSAKELSIDHSVSITAIYDIKNGKSWNHVTKLELTRKKK